MKAKLLHVSLDCIDLGDRVRVVYTEVESLAASIKDVDLLQPIAVMELEEKGKFMLHAGGRRIAAVRLLGWTEIACKIFPFTTDKRMWKLRELTENIEREDLTYSEEARLIRDIHNLQVAIKGEKTSWKSDGHSMADTARLIGKGSSYVETQIHLADACDEDPTMAEMKNRTEAVSAIAKRRENVIIAEQARRATQKALHQEDPKSELLKRYRIGDTLEILGDTPNETYHMIEIDPPYLIELRKVVKTTAKETELLRGGKMTEEEEIEALTWLQTIFSESYRVLKPNGWVICWFAIDPWIKTFKAMLDISGFAGNMVPGLWVKNNGNTRTPNIHLSNFFEPFLYARKGNAMLAKPAAANVFRFPIIPSKIHPNEKPIELYMDIFRVFCNPGAKILSTFVGSGNPILAASNVNMECDGIDKNEDYYKHFVARVQGGKPGEYKSYKM